MSDFQHLGAPLRQGRLDLKNRIVHAAILTRFASNERATERLVRYHEARAAGGAAMIIAEAVNALPSQAGRGVYLNAHSDTGINDLAQLADAAHAHDCRILAQLQERGRGNYAIAIASRAFGPSALPDDIAGAVPHPLSTSDVERMIADFAAAARRLERAGFDGVEISAGHGHLFHQFLSAHANRREDRFGGDLAGRMTFLDETVKAVRAACGPGFLIALKLPAEDGDPGGVDLAQAAQIAEALAQPRDVDLISFAWGAQNRFLHWHVPDGHAPRAPYAEKTARLRAAANGVPVIGLGRIVDPNEGEAMLASGQADLVGLGRALIADPDWPRKALGGATHSIRACVSCNTCWGAIAAGASLACDANPDVTDAPAAPALISGRRRTVVVGGGPSGLAMAATAAEAGDETTVFQSGPRLGGRAGLASWLPGGDGLQGVFDHDAARATAAGARIELGHDATAEDVAALAPDRIGLAVGAEAPWPEAGPLHDPTVASPLANLLRLALEREGSMGRRLVLIVLDDNIWVYRAAERLLAVFDEIVIVLDKEIPAAREPLVVRQGLLERLARLPITVRPHAIADPNMDELAEGRFGCVEVLTGTRFVIPEVDVVSHAAPRRPRLNLAAALRQRGFEPLVIGDAYQPRALLHAVSEGRRAGR